MNLLQCCFCFMFCFFGSGACGILASQPGIEPASLTLEGEVLTTGPPGKFRLPHVFFEVNPRHVIILVNISVFIYRKSGFFKKKSSITMLQQKLTILTIILYYHISKCFVWMWMHVKFTHYNLVGLFIYFFPSYLFIEKSRSFSLIISQSGFYWLHPHGIV